MSEPRNIIEERLKIRNYQTDFAQKLRPSAILGLFQEIAAEHSEEMGFGHSVLKKNETCVEILRHIAIPIPKDAECYDCSSRERARTAFTGFI